MNGSKAKLIRKVCYGGVAVPRTIVTNGTRSNQVKNHYRKTKKAFQKLPWNVRHMALIQKI